MLRILIKKKLSCDMPDNSRFSTIYQKRIRAAIRKKQAITGVFNGSKFFYFLIVLQSYIQSEQ